MDLSNENILHIKNDDFEFLQFKKLLKYSDCLSHGYSLGINRNFRTGKANGQIISSEEYSKAINDYKDFCDCINLNYKNIIKTKQNHTDNIKIINEKINIDGPDTENYSNTDGLITNKKDLILATTNADCILLLFFDPVKKVIANVHSGWKGTIKRISVKTVKKMKMEFNSNPKDIICAICPSIRKCHFEVDKDVSDIFYNEFKDLKNIDEIIEKDLHKEKWYVDTVEINKIILLNEGLLKDNIIDCKICSVCNKEYIHSYRVEKEGYGLSTAIISLI